jgi:ATP-dependent Clp protease protease subunit
MKQFWRWAKDEATGERTLYLSGPIAEETWFGDEVTPAAFRSELIAGAGPVTVWINSPGGCVFAAAQIYNMLMEYNGPVTVKIDGIAASAASVIAMAGGEVHMSPVSMLMIHNPATVAVGDSEEMLRAKALLDEVKESIINSYELKTGLSRAKLSHFMDNETWMNAHKAVELGFADKIMFAADNHADAGQELALNKTGAGLFSRSAVTNSLLGKIPKAKESTPPVITGTPIESLDKRLSLLFH